EGDTVDPGLDPWDDNSTLTEQISLHKLTENGNTTDYEQPFDSTTPLIDANYIEYLNYLEKFLNTSDPTNDFNYQYPDSYDYSFNLSTTFNTSTTPKKLTAEFFGAPGPSLYMPPGQQIAFSPPFVPGGIMATRLAANLSSSSASSNATNRMWTPETASYSNPMLRTLLNPRDLNPIINPITTTTTTTTTTARTTSSTVRATNKLKTKRTKSVTTRSSRRSKSTTLTATKRSKQFRSFGETRTTTTTTTTKQPPNVRRSLKKPTSTVRRDRRYLGSRNRPTPNAILRRRTGTGKRFRKLGQPTPTARRRKLIPLARPRQRQRPWAMPPLMLDYEFWMF
uniref:Uncharacterized protein n=2 Tax=Anopheles albimanus TaxID=7167 RepID=A0A182F9C6_ANOAL